MDNFKHKKSLGQNFLTDRGVIDRIVDLADIGHQDLVLEIGPGQGYLTDILAQKSKKVMAIEIDERLIPFLQDKFRMNERVDVVHGNILHMDIGKFINEETPYKVVANIPYYITAPIIRLLLECAHQPSLITLMVQKEVAERLCAKEGEMSILSVSAQYYADVSYGFTVSRMLFDPVPKVDSAVVVLNTKRVASDHDLAFFRTVKIGFSARRKTLCNNIANGFHMSKNDVLKIFTNIGFDENTRAQELSVAHWGILTKALLQ